MRTARLIGLGFGRAWKIKAPVLLIALVNLALALVITAPVYKWFRDHLNESSDALNLLHGPTARFLFELSQYDRTNVYSLIRTSFLWTAILGFFLAVFLAAGLFAALARPDTRPRFSHFFFFAANLFPRFLAMTVLVGAAAIVFVIALNIPMTAISYRLTQRSVSDMSPIWLALVQFAISGLFILYFFLILDYARIDTVVYPDRPLLRSLVVAFLLVSRRFLRTFLLALVFLALLLILFAVYVLWRWSNSIAATAPFLLTLLLQQVVVFGRYGLRAGMIGSEVELHAAWVPAPVAPPDAEYETQLARARQKEQVHARVLRRLAPPRTSGVGALRRNLGLLRRRE